MNSRKLKLIVMPNCKKLGESIDYELKRINKTDNSFLVDFKPDRFGNGEGKVKINESVNNTD